MKKFLALLLSAVLAAGMAVPALAAEEDGTARRAQSISPWAYSAMADLCALGLWSDEYLSCIQDPVTETQLQSVCAVVADKLALLNVAPSQGAGEPLVIDCTRGGVKNALYQEAAAYQMPFVDTDVEFMIRELGVAFGDGTDNDLNGRPCTLQETLVMACRLIMSLYDYYDAGSQGLLWKAEGNGVTLYLLGTLHVDRGNIYPLCAQLRNLISSADGVIFELDLNDTQGMAALAAMQIYSDGTTLKDHIGAELYEQTVAALADRGVPEETTALYKPWALANTFQTLAAMDASTGETYMAVDSYVNALAVNAGASIGSMESYEYQGGIFDSLSAAYQESYLQEALDAYLGQTGAEEADGEKTLLDRLTQEWEDRDVDAFTATYDKESILARDDELTAALFADRDSRMTAAAAEILANDLQKTFLADDHKVYVMAVGAGHMIGSTGIVQGLRNLGYTVEVVEAP